MEVGGERDVLKPSMAMPALLMTKSIPPLCARDKCSARDVTLALSVMSRVWNLISERPPWDVRAAACVSWGSCWRVWRAASPRDLSRAVRSESECQCEAF